jgi:hypothetical protein
VVRLSLDCGERRKESNSKSCMWLRGGEEMKGSHCDGIMSSQGKGNVA